MAKRFNVTGLCLPEKHYMVDLTQRIKKIREMVDEGLYFVINRARQYGKTTTLTALARELERDYLVINLDFQMLGSASFQEENTFALSFLRILLRELKRHGGAESAGTGQILEWMQEVLEKNDRDFHLLALSELLLDFCECSVRPVVLMIDEVDSASDNQVFLDFLAQLRNYYLEREAKGTVVFHSVILAGVYNVKNLRRKVRPEEEHRVNSPWNIAADFRISMSFSEEEIAGMLREYEADHHTGMDMDQMSGLLYDYTSGYPYLVSRLCRMMDEEIDRDSPWTREGFLEAVRLLLQESNTLFESLVSKITAYPELEQMLRELLFSGKAVTYSPTNPAVGLAVMFGFVKNDKGKAVPANRIFDTLLYDRLKIHMYSWAQKGYNRGKSARLQSGSRAIGQEESMGILSHLEPGNVFGFFEEITRIPHGSGNVGQISDYLADFAGERGLECIQDRLGNIIIIKEASPGYEKEPAVILQGHMDMVAVKKPDCPIDMKKEGLRVAVRGDEVYAEGTSLGGDDGIAVAYALALLDSHTIRHPRLEVVITVDEEVGMDGARGIDLSMLTGSRMINLDSEEEGIFLTSCAGGARVKCRLPLAAVSRTGAAVEVAVGGLQGGHSGGEIHKERGNANCLLARVIYRLAKVMPVCLSAAEGGLADNAIPREAHARLVLEEKDLLLFRETVQTLEAEIREELGTKDPGVTLRAQEPEAGSFTCVSPEDTRRAAAFLLALPGGVQAMSADMPGLVETSLNLGILKYEEGELKADFSVRSSVESAKYALMDRISAVVELAGGSSVASGDYPGWKYRKDSPLREKMVALYERMYGKAPRVEAIHAGLECGILGSKIRNLDCVSIGPQMKAIHTTEETLSISSTGRVWDFLVRLLEEKDA